MEYNRVLIFSNDSKNLSLIKYDGNNQKDYLKPTDDSKGFLDEYITNEEIESITSLQNDVVAIKLSSGNMVIVDGLSRVLTACIGTKFDKKYISYAVNKVKHNAKDKVVTKTKNINKKVVSVSLIATIALTSIIAAQAKKSDYDAKTNESSTSISDELTTRETTTREFTTKKAPETEPTTITTTTEPTTIETTEYTTESTTIETTEKKNYNDQTVGNSGSKLNYYNGTVYYNGHRETYYEQEVLPGPGLNIPGRHVASDGTVRDEDGYIVVASDLDFLPRYSIVETSLGTGKVYDTGCAYGTIDIYVSREPFKANARK